MQSLEIKRAYEQLSWPIKWIVIFNLAFFTFILAYSEIKHGSGLTVWGILVFAFNIGAGVSGPIYFYINRHSINFLANYRDASSPSSGLGAKIFAYLISVGWASFWAACLIVDIYKNGRI